MTDFALNTFSVTTDFASQATALIITPASVPAITAGVAYSPLVTFTGHGSVLTPFNFVVSPVSANQLPTGLTLTNASATTATIQGTTIQIGSRVVTIRLTDNSGAYVDVPFTFNVTSGLAIHSGIDYTDGLSIGQLGFVDAGNVASLTSRPNFSFFVVATGVVTTFIPLLTVQTNNVDIVGTVKTLSGGVAQIELSGTGFNTTNGTHSVTVTVIDSGVHATATFTWVVYDGGTMALAASNAIPTRLTTPT